MDVVQLERAGVLNDLPYRFEVKRYDPAAFFIASRYPLGHTSVVSYYGRPLIVETTLKLPTGPQNLWVVHTIAPLPSSFTDWQGMLSTIARRVEARGPTGLLVVGDFNATWGNKGFRQILGDGMTDAAAARGQRLRYDLVTDQAGDPTDRPDRPHPDRARCGGHPDHEPT